MLDKNWKDYIEPLSEKYPDIDKSTIRKILFYGFKKLYSSCLSVSKSTMFPVGDNGYLHVGKKPTIKKEIKKKTVNIPDKSKYLPEWFVFPEFFGTYYCSIKYADMLKLRKNGNCIKNAHLTTSLDYAKITGGVVIKIYSPIFYGLHCRHDISFSSYEIIGEFKNVKMKDFYYKYNDKDDL